jgi:hypothetical protein
MAEVGALSRAGRRLGYVKVWFSVHNDGMDPMPVGRTGDHCAKGYRGIPRRVLRNILRASRFCSVHFNLAAHLDLGMSFRPGPPVHGIRLR